MKMKWMKKLLILIIHLIRWNWKYNKIEHENDNEIVNYIKNLKNKDIKINTEDLLEFSK